MPQTSFRNLKIASIVFGLLMGAVYSGFKVLTFGMPSGNLINLVVLVTCFRVCMPILFKKYFGSSTADQNLDEIFLKKIRWLAYAEGYFFALLFYNLVPLYCSSVFDSDRCPAADPQRLPISIGFTLLMLLIVNIRYFLINRKESSS